jgi:beta-galactosidase
MQLSSDKPWANKGYAVATDQFLIQKKGVISLDTKMESTNQVAETNTEYKIKGKDFSISISKESGALNSYIANGEEQVVAPLLPNFVRPLTDNDKRGWKSHKVLKQWYQAKPQLKTIKLTSSNKGIQITSDYEIIKDSAQVRMVYIINSEGIIQVNYNLTASDKLPNIPKVGLQMGILKKFDLVSWYGKGELENYSDRSFGFPIRKYALPLQQFIEPYVKPQENGNRTAVRWMAFSTPKIENGLLIVNDKTPLSMSAWPYTQENLKAATHTFDLKDAGYITVNIDLIQMGVGGNDSWSPVAQPLEQYQIPSRNYEYSFYLIPFSKSKKGLEASLKKFNY